MELYFLSLYVGDFTDKETNKTMKAYYLIGVPTGSCRPNVYKVVGRNYPSIVDLDLESGEKINVYFDANNRISLVNRV